MLALCLETLARQTLDTDAFEVIVVDDRSSDGSVDLLRDQARDAPFALRWLQQEQAGPAARTRTFRSGSVRRATTYWQSATKDLSVTTITTP